MKRKLRTAIVGFGKLGQACARAIESDNQLELTGIVRRREKLKEPLPPSLKHITVAGHLAELPSVDAAFLCLPTLMVHEAAEQILQHRISIVECATLHNEAFIEHKNALDRLAHRNKATAIVGAGWDPGYLSLMRSLFALGLPHGHTETRFRPGRSLHHTPVSESVEGVRKALSTELHSEEGGTQRYLYVELKKGADPEQVFDTLRSDPLFLDEPTQIFAVDSISALEDESHGVLIERHGQAAGLSHQQLLLEARYTLEALAAEIMVAAARTLPTRHHRAYSLFDLPLRALWGERHSEAEERWL